ncbi:MAG: AAA family ATPase [Woeseiaceae bacterium]
MAELTESDLQIQVEKLAATRREIARVIVGQQVVVEEVLIALLAGGHCLLQGVPGLGKTKLLQTLAKVIDLPFGRIQFTPDLMPGDIIGTELLSTDDDGGRRFEFQRGPVFTSMLLADEINRTPPKTQSALLEAMAERHVTFAGATHDLPDPFFVMATQNPLEQAGTYPLPEAQLDRFLLMVEIQYPDADEEQQILALTTRREDASVSVCMQEHDVRQLRAWVRDISISPALLQYVVSIVRATRPDRSEATSVAGQWIRWGAGPRAGQAMVLAAKARALLQGRLSVTVDDLMHVAKPVLRHRIILNYAADAEHHSTTDVIAQLLEAVPEPADPLASEIAGRG